MLLSLLICLFYLNGKNIINRKGFSIFEPAPVFTVDDRERDDIVVVVAAAATFLASCANHYFT